MLAVLFVCTGNICRSPLAEAFLADRSERLLGGRVRVASAGTWAGHDSPPMPEAILVARERGLDASAQRSRRLTPALLAEAGLVLALAGEHSEEIVEVDPSAASRTFTLKELAAILAEMPPLSATDVAGLRARIAEADRRRRPGLGGDVRDPLGMGLDAYRDAGWDIEAAIDQVVEGLFGVREPAGSA